MTNSRLHLFQGYGVELEYMIVDKETLAVKPITDELLKKVAGAYVSDVERGKVTWCNELVLHVVELKCTRPEIDLAEMEREFHENILHINKQLAAFNAELMPAAAHPFMVPAKETFLWPHDSNEIYETYNRIFNCSGHGWSNLQSTHLNLPFYDDEEFAKLHAAIRCILPILPALAASSPVLGGKDTGFLDKRLDYYQKNQKIIPSITGSVIPEKVFSKRQYQKHIYDRIAHEVAPYDTDKILQPVWLNSRGAMARFDRGSIEIRILDIQECPKADMAIISLIVGLLRMLINERMSTYKFQQHWEVEPLFSIFQQTVKHGEQAVITDPQYLQIFGLDIDTPITAGDLWKEIYLQVESIHPAITGPWSDAIEVILKQGTLASRINRSLGGLYTPENIRLVYSELVDCLKNNEMFEVCVTESC